MEISKFYSLIDKELEAILDKYPNDEELHKHKKHRNQNKGYALLIWFLNFYGQKELYKNYITDGKDDSSCDIIFSNIDSQGDTIFYVVQSKWVNYDGTKEYPQIKKEEFNATIAEFSSILSGEKRETKNEKFNKKYQELITHLENNGKAKFIFFTLADENTNEKDNINFAVNSFNSKHLPHERLEVFDINRIRRDYIEFKFKEIVSINPLEYEYSPEEVEIEIDIERFKNGDNGKQVKRDLIEFEGRTKAYIFILKPKTIHGLFKKYKFNLFFKNVRNPLYKSIYNQNIVNTLKNKPDAFWFFNNGVTAITKAMPEIGQRAEKVKINGLQVINGAQTVFSIYEAYENASKLERKIMDTDARITMRLIRSSDEDFSAEITRYTNSQNPMEDRDFVANDDIQQHLQNESFKTNYWYEKRRGEFREEQIKGLDVNIVPSNFWIEAYVSFYLQKPFWTVDTNKLFISRKKDENGLYEQVFANIKFENVLASLLFESILRKFIKQTKKLDHYDDLMLSIVKSLILGISKILLERYLEWKYVSKNINIPNFIIKAYEEEETDKINSFNQITVFSFIWCSKVLAKMGNASFTKEYSSIYERILEEIKSQEIDFNKIERYNIKLVWQEK
ncbi:MAG: AIPR family protein [Thermoflexibacter sp.]|jgi:hypothetical protein|nr:AIPR family protein [Thermoflexibacter sp.]